MERKEIVTLDPRHLRISSYATGAGSPIMIEVIHIPTGHVVKREDRHGTTYREQRASMMKELEDQMSAALKARE